MKKFVNDPNAVAREALQGLALAHPGILRALDGVQAVVRRNAPVSGKVAVLTGGGSGHEPMFAGFVGEGLADGSVAGNIFASPPPITIAQTARAIHSGCGVLFVYGNYSGDVLNFDMAAEELIDEGIEVATVRVADDVASAPAEKRCERRGVAGDLFVIKAAGAAAATGVPLSEVLAAAELANRNTGSMGVALSSCIIPASGKFIFSMPDDQMELGMGVHGEPGIRRGPLMPAHEVTQFLVDNIVRDLQLESGEEVAVLVNGAGATPLAELYIVFGSVFALLAEAGIRIATSYVGNYATSLDMAGCSITLVRLNTELKYWIEAPCQSVALVQA
jgi:dihydroxyacetone kinase